MWRSFRFDTFPDLIKFRDFLEAQSLSCATLPGRVLHVWGFAPGQEIELAAWARHHRGTLNA
jgi:hypothetical protein